MIAEIDDQRILRFTGSAQRGEQIANQRVEAADAVVVVRRLLAQLWSIQSEVSQRPDIITGQWLLGHG